MRAALILLVGCGFHGSAGPTDASVDGAPGPDALDPDAPPPSPTATFVFEAEAFSGVTVGMAHANSWAIETTIPGHSGLGYLHLVPHDGDTCTIGTAGSCATASYGALVTLPGTYYLHLRGYATGTNNDSVTIGMDGVPSSTTTAVPNDSAWHWLSPQSFTLTAGSHVAAMWQRESGVRIDLVVLSRTTSDPALP